MLQQDNKSKEDIGNVLRAITIKKTLVHIIQEWNIPGNKEISYVNLTEGYERVPVVEIRTRQYYIIIVSNFSVSNSPSVSYVKHGQGISYEPKFSCEFPKNI